jgi:SAM-dependent methyltransferase
MSAYDPTFFADHLRGSTSSARVVVPLLRSLVGFSSVVDVGCGIGAWLSVFAETGTGDFLGLDGPWVKPEDLLIPRERFVSADLARAEPPAAAGRRFDLALSVEVAEHLPEGSADRFVAMLTGLAPVVAFSAAIPGQGGTDHVNEQWPDYWAAKFAARGYVWIDAVRPRVWADPRVQWWYAQNLVVYADRTRLSEQPALGALVGADQRAGPSRLVHPECFEVLRTTPIGLRTIAREAPRAIRRAVAARLGRGGKGAA